AELRLFVDVAVHEGEPGQHQQVLVLLAIARQHRDRMPVLDQAGDQAGAEESGTAENANRQRPHEHHRMGIKTTALPRLTLSIKKLAPFATSRKAFNVATGV